MERRRGRLARLLGGTMLAGAAMAVMLPVQGLAQSGTAAGGTGSGSIVLDPIDVETRRDADASGTTEGSGSYAAKRTTVGGKAAAPIREIPNSVSVVTRERIEDQNLVTLDQAMRKTNGMVVLNNDAGRSSIFSRGFEFDQLFVDGLPAPLSSIRGTQIDLAIFDRIEVLRGADGLFSGSGEPAGTINLARKRPGDKPAFSASVAGGSWSTGRAEIDVGGPLIASGKVRGRVVGAFQAMESFVDVNDNQSAIGYGDVEIDLTENTTLSVAAWHQERDITPFNGLPAYADGTLLDLDRSTFVGADWNRFDNASTETIVELEHRFDDGGHVKAAMRYADRDGDFKYAYSRTAVNPATGAYQMTALQREYWEESLALDTHVLKPFEVFGLTQTILAGIDYRRQGLKEYTGNANVAGTYNIFAPISAVPEPNVAYTSRTDIEPEQYGIYGQARIKPWEPLTLIAGGRFSWYQSDTTNLATGAVSSIDVDAFTPQFGAIFDITGNISAYASYSEIFQPQTNLTFSGEQIDPRTGDQYEIGLKGEFFDGALNGHIGYFNIHDTDRAVGDPDHPGFSLALGEVEVSGFEIEASGSPLAGLELTAGYTYTDTEYVRGSAGQAGTTFSTYTPEHMVTLWGKYTLQEGLFQGLWIGAGAKVMSEFYNQNGAVRFVEDGYVVVDAALGYHINRNIEASLTVTNLFDEVYYARTGSATVFNFYGEPRSALFKLSAKY